MRFTTFGASDAAGLNGPGFDSRDTAGSLVAPEVVLPVSVAAAAASRSRPLVDACPGEKRGNVGSTPLAGG